MSTLHELFHGKCAFCETRVDQKTGGVDRYRPIRDAMDDDGSVSKEHYWPFAYDWDNLLLLCPECNRAKGTRFPVDGRRGEMEESGLGPEKAWLLDPCDPGFDPFEHFVFRDTGVVDGLTERALATIAVVNLNRENLVRRRRILAEVLPRQQDDRARASAAELDAWHEAQMHDRAEFAQLRRQLLSARGREAAESSEAIEDTRRTSAYSLVDPDAVGVSYFGKSRFVEHIEIENFKAIEHLVIDVASDVAGTPWTVLLGENGTAKSTVLQAVCLALAGEAVLQHLGENIDPAKLIRYGQDETRVEVKLSDGQRVVLTGSKKAGWDLHPDEPKMLVLAYGATRLLPGPGSQIQNPHRWAKVSNLFNPFVALSDAGTWLVGLEDDRFELIATRVKSLLDLPDDSRLLRVENEDHELEVKFQLGSSILDLDQVSDGYNAMLALTCELSSVAYDIGWEDPELAEGLVLIDEIGVHLHPRWQMRIVERLRATFPRMQFIVTTHQPLCLRGVQNGEVVAMRKFEDRIVVQPELPHVVGLRVDQLLTSEHFGLNSTLDPAVEALLSEYYALLAKRERTHEDDGQIAAIREELDDRKLLGRDRRERMMLEVIDEFLADPEAREDPMAKLEIEAETKDKLRRIWKRVGFNAGTR